MSHSVLNQQKSTKILDFPLLWKKPTCLVTELPKRHKVDITTSIENLHPWCPLSQWAIQYQAGTFKDNDSAQPCLHDCMTGSGAYSHFFLKPYMDSSKKRIKTVKLCRNNILFGHLNEEQIFLAFRILPQIIFGYVKTHHRYWGKELLFINDSNRLFSTPYLTIHFLINISGTSFPHWQPNDWSSYKRVSGLTTDHSADCCLSNTLKM